MSETTLTGQDLYETIQTLLSKYLAATEDNYDELFNSILKESDLPRKDFPVEYWGHKNEFDEYMGHKDKFDKLTEREKDNIKSYVKREEVIQFSNLLDTLLSGNIDLKSKTLLTTIQTMTNDSFKSLKMYFTDQQENRVGTVYYDITGRKRTDTNETTDITKEQYTKEITKLQSIEPVLLVSTDTNYKTEIDKIREKIKSKLQKIIKPWKTLQEIIKPWKTKQLTDLHKNINDRLNDVFTSSRGLKLEYALSQLVQKNKLSLLAEFMYTKCTIIEEIITVITTLSPPSSYIGSSDGIESSLAHSPDESFKLATKGAAGAAGAAGYFIVGGVHNLHTIPNMYNDYRKRKSRKSRKLRTARKLRKSRKSRKPRKSRKLIK